MLKYYHKSSTTSNAQLTHVASLSLSVSLSYTHLSEEVSVQVNLPEPRAREGKESGPLAERLQGNAENRREH